MVKHYEPSITHIGKLANIVLVIERNLLEHAARSQIYIFGPSQVALPLRSLPVLIGIDLQVSFLAFDVFAFLF